MAVCSNVDIELTSRKTHLTQEHDRSIYWKEGNFVIQLDRSSNSSSMNVENSLRKPHCSSIKWVNKVYLQDYSEE